MKNMDKEKENMRKNNADKLRPVLVDFILRIVFLGVVVLIMTVFVFGIYRIPDDSMSPGMKAGDIALVYRLDKNYFPRDLVLYKFKGEVHVRRVVAIEGDKVEITDKGLAINGKAQNEINIYEETLAYEEGVEYPVRLQKKELFLLADSRRNASDSRYYGPVKVSDTRGMVIAVLRHNGL